MKNLLIFILENILEGQKVTVEEVDEGSKVDLKIEADKDVIGLVIGKGGRTIKALQDILRVRGRLEGKSVFVNVTEKAY